jgi:outer membrane protein TolC
MKIPMALAVVSIASLFPFAARAEGRESVSFAKALALARTRSVNVALAEADVARAEALVRQARAASFPTLTGNGTYTRLDGDRLVADRIVQGADSLGLNLNLTVPLVAASRWGAWKRAEDAADVVGAQKRAQERDVVVAAGRAYLAVLLQKKALTVAERGRDVAKQHLGFAEAREKGGIGTRLDVVRASQEVEATEAQLAQSRLALVRSEEALGTTLGVDHPVDAAEEPALEVARAEDLRDRPDLRAQARDVQAKERASRDAIRDYIPTLTGSFQPFYQNPATITLPETGWQAQLALSVPLFDGGLRYGQDRERKAALAQARARYDDAFRRARSEVRVAETAIEEAAKVVERARTSASLAREAAGLAQVAYTQGASTNLELLDADRRARDAESQLALSEDAVRQARLEWLGVTGVLR